MKLFASVDRVVLKQETSNGLVASIAFYNCLEVSVELGEDGSRQESCLQFITALWLYMSPSEGNIFC